MIKKTAVVLMLAVLSSLLGGCWSRKEISELAIVLGVGVDLLPNDQIRLSVQIAQPGAFYGGGGARGGGMQTASWAVSAEGKTIDEAARYLAMRVPREIYWGHSMILVIGEKMAREGIGLIGDFFNREKEPRETMWLLVAEGEARDVLECGSILEKTSAQAAAFLTRMKTGFAVELREFAEMLASKGVQPVATRVIVKEQGAVPCAAQEGVATAYRQVEVSGLAIFKEDRLVGWLDDYETRGFLWLKGETFKGIITVPSPGDAYKAVSLRLRQAQTKVVPEYDGERIRFSVKIRTEADMVEQQSFEDLAKPEKIKALESLMAEEIRAMATTALEKVQRGYGVDIFGFGDAFHRKYKEDWRRLKDRWDEEFIRAEVSVTVEAHIREIGMLTRPAFSPEE
ncbi:MAG TPA: Ger(x)C family spore germination protein [Firmicutes bacterium]|nr:Ger(x)C family spore germination protein [Bacillota bacterium]